MTRRDRFWTATALTTLAAAVISQAAASPAFAFKERWHKALVWSALPFVKESYRKQIAKIQDAMDEPLHVNYAGLDKWHFNDCDFAGASSNLASVYDDTVKALKSGKADKAAELFGRALHTAQDFYAHTNWIDLKPAGAESMTALIDSSAVNWKPIVPWTAIGNGPVAVSKTHPRPGNVTFVKVEPPDRARLRVLIDGVEHPVLISGEATWRMNCPEEAVIGHWDDRPGQCGGLAKDYPCREPARGFHAACTLALRQTYQEWCRLRTLAAADKDATKTLDTMLIAEKADAKICAEKAFLLPSFPGKCE
jgi:hypothetical protein